MNGILFPATRVLLAMLLCLLSTYGVAQSFPWKPLAIVVPYASGSGSDAQARVFAKHLSTVLGKPVVVENRPGANGAVGFQHVQGLPADGHTVLVGGGSPFLLNPLLVKNLGYEPSKFLNVSGISRATAGYVVAASSPYETVDELIAATHRTGKPLQVGVYGTIYELGAVWLGKLSNTKVEPISYKGASAVVTDLIGGHLGLGLMDLSAVGELIKDRKIRVVGLTSSNASPIYQGVPVLKDRYSDYVIEPWTSFLVRADTPAPTVARLAEAMRESFTSKEVLEYFNKSGMSDLNLQSDEMDRFIEREEARARMMVRAANLMPQ